MQRTPLTARILTALTLPKSRRAVVECLRGEGAKHVWLRVLLWWCASIVTLAVYSMLRGKMDNAGMPVHGAEWERSLFGGLPTVWLQENVWVHWKHSLEWASVIVHSSWFFVPSLVGVFVTLRRPERVGSFFRWWIALELLALPLFALLPTQPPWMASDDVTRLIALRFGGQIEDPNALAAMPSLHVAFPLLLALWFRNEQWRWPAIAMFAYTGAISVEVVFSGEHYVVDVLGAAGFAVGVALASRINARSIIARFSSLVSSRSAGEVGRLTPALEVARTARRRETGQALVEFAFMMPVLLAFVLVIVDFGIAVDRRLVLQHSVREGARRAAVGASVNETKTLMVDQSQGLLDLTDITVCYIDRTSNGFGGDQLDGVKVSANYTYEFSVGGGEMLTAIGMPMPSINMSPSAESAMDRAVTTAPPC